MNPRVDGLRFERYRCVASRTRTERRRRARYRGVNPSANNDLVDTSPLVQCRHWGTPGETAALGEDQQCAVVLAIEIVAEQSRALGSRRDRGVADAITRSDGSRTQKRWLDE